MFRKVLIVLFTLLIIGFVIPPTTKAADCIVTAGICPGSNPYGCTTKGKDAVCCTNAITCNDYKKANEPPAPTTEPSGPPIEGCGIQTAIGCIPIMSEQTLALFFLRWGMGLGGGIALILIAASTFNIMTSAGDPRKLQVGKEMLTSAIAGLMLLVFSAYILNFIGVDLLGILN